MGRRRGLYDLSSYMNVNEDEAAGRRVGEERTRLEQTEVFGWRADVIMFRRFRRIPLAPACLRAFTGALWSTKKTASDTVVKGKSNQKNSDDQGLEVPPSPLPICPIILCTGLQSQDFLARDTAGTWFLLLFFLS